MRDNIQERLHDIMNQYPELRKVNADYDTRLKRKFQVVQNGDDTSSAYAAEIQAGKAESRIVQKYGTVITTLCRDLGLDNEMMTRLVIHESRGNSNSESPRGAQGLMQIMPDTAQDFARRFALYQLHFQNISPEIIGQLKSPTAVDAMRKLTKALPAGSRTGEAAVRSMLRNMYDPEINLIFGHVYFAGLRTQLEPKIETVQRDLYRYFSNLTHSQFQQISASRRAMGAAPLSLEYLQGEYARRLNRDSQFALDTESLIQYNGGGNRPKQSYNYAATIQA